METKNITVPGYYAYTQIRIARPTASLEKISEFYISGLGLTRVGGFSDENISGIMIGLPGEAYHLEFAQHKNMVSCLPPTKDNLLVFYLPGTMQRDLIVNRLLAMGYAAVEPGNPYWKKHGITIEDPDKWRIVLMDISSFNDPGQ